MDVIDEIDVLQLFMVDKIVLLFLIKTIKINNRTKYC